MKVPKQEWVFMPHAGHLIVGNDCRFHLATRIGRYLVSTVGEYFPDETVREIHAKSRGIILEGCGDTRQADFLRKCGYIDIGFQRKYETMVFPVVKGELGCCPWEMSSGTELDSDGYNDPAIAYKGHLAMCEKWAKK